MQSVKLKGHQGAVLCLDHSSSRSTNESPHQHSSSITAACLLSGSEDATARLWDLRASCRAALCIKTAGEVLSVAFGPSWEEPLANNDTAPSPFSRDFTVYLSVESSVVAYDLRKTTSPLITDPPAWDLTPILESPDEVNQIAFSPIRRGRPLHLAAADDSGSVRVTDCLEPSKDGRPVTQPSGRKRILPHGQHDQQQQEQSSSLDPTAAVASMVTSVAFRPRCKNLEVASGGTDCTVQLWDVSKPKRPVSVLKIPNTDAGANQVCNPPMVHGLEWSPSGRLLAAACGDGSCCLLQADNRSLVLAARLEAHGGAIASVVFPEWTNSSIILNDYAAASRQTQHVAAHDRLLLTAGNDGFILLWDLGSMLGGEGARDPSSLLQLPSNNGTDAPDASGSAVAAQMGDLSLDNNDDSDGQPRVLCSIPHGAKPNWMVSSRGRDPVFPSSIFVADTSNDITAYTIPLQ
jgi:WD40 repeat protein